MAGTEKKIATLEKKVIGLTNENLDLIGKNQILDDKNQALNKKYLDIKTKYNKVRKENRQYKDTIAKLSKNSGNSSKSPSSDIVKPPRKHLPKGKRKIGGQPGHKKHERPLFVPSEVHDTFEYKLAECPTCQNGLDLDLNQKPKIIQQIEIKEVPIEIEEHKAYAYWCDNCKKYHYADFPGHVVKAGMFKARVTATVAYMKNLCHCSFSTIRKYFRDILKIKVSRGYLSKVISKVSNCLDASYQELLNILPFTANVNVDETRHKENKVKFWTWVFKADLFVLFKIDKSRGSKVLIDVLGKEFNGVLGCDYYSSYQKYMKDFNVTVQFCIAHLIRDMRFLAAYPDEEIKKYGELLLDQIRELFKTIHEKDQLQPDVFTEKLTQIKHKIIEIAIDQAPSEIDDDGKELKRPALNMANRFIKHGQAYFEFITSPQVEPTNNIAEQAIRFIVIDRYITQGTRSIKGRKASERLWTVIATCALQGKSAFDFIVKSVEAYFYTEPYPSLIYDTS
jgi:transposase